MTEFAHAARRTPHTPQRHVPGALALGDFTADRRMVMLVAMAVVVGAAGAAGAWVLLRLIALVSNLVWLGQIGMKAVDFGQVRPSPWMVLVPVLGGLLIGLMARFGSEKIRGHGIPEAIEAILIGRSRIRRRWPCSSRSPRRSPSAPAARSAPRGRSS